MAMSSKKEIMQGKSFYVQIFFSNDKDLIIKNNIGDIYMLVLLPLSLESHKNSATFKSEHDKVRTVSQPFR